MKSKIERTNKALELAQKYNGVKLADDEAQAVFKEYTDFLRAQHDYRSLTFLLPYTQGTKKITENSLTIILWQAALARDGMYVR